MLAKLYWALPLTQFLPQPWNQHHGARHQTCPVARFDSVVLLWGRSQRTSTPVVFWLVVEPTHLKNMSQIGNLPQIGVKMKNIWNHHLVFNMAKLEMILFSDGAYICPMLSWIVSLNKRNNAGNLGKYILSLTSECLQELQHLIHTKPISTYQHCSQLKNMDHRFIEDS